MKTFIPYSILVTAAASGLSFGVESSTTPIGVITHSIAGAGVNPSADTYISPTLVNAVEYAGASTASPSGGAVITLPSGVPATFDGSYVLEITSPANEGWWSTVVSSDATSITVSDNFPDELPANVTISVRKHATISTFLGFNTPGLIPSTGLNTADEVQFFDPVAQSGTAFVFVTADDWGDLGNYPDGVWLNQDTGLAENDAIIEPGTAVRIKRVDPTALTFTSNGTVKTTKTQVDIYPGFNFVGVPKAANGTLGNLNFAPQLNLWNGLSINYDELQKVAPDQSAAGFGAVDDGGPVMWNISLSGYATDEPFQEGTGVLLKRTGNPASTITLEGSLVTP